MIPDRLPWRLRARPSATLHEIQVRPEGQTCLDYPTDSGRVRQVATTPKLGCHSEQAFFALTASCRAGARLGPHPRFDGVIPKPRAFTDEARDLPLHRLRASAKLHQYPTTFAWMPFRASVLCVARNLGEPRDASRLLRRTDRAFGSHPHWTNFTASGTAPA
jgi:hypothetical protein